MCHPDRQEKREPAGSKPVSLDCLLRKPASLDAGSSQNPDSKGKYGLFLLAEPCLKSVGFGDVTVEIFITTPLLEKADEFNRVLNNLDENIICEIRSGENAKVLEQYERITKTDRLGEFERRLERKRRKEAQDRYLQGYKNGTPGPYQRRITYMPPW